MTLSLATVFAPHPRKLRPELCEALISSPDVGLPFPTAGFSALSCECYQAVLSEEDGAFLLLP